MYVCSGRAGHVAMLHMQRLGLVELGVDPASRESSWSRTVQEMIPGMEAERTVRYSRLQLATRLPHEIWFWNRE